MPAPDPTELLKTPCGQDKGVAFCTRGPKLQCVNGHDVAKNFPYDGFWDYCCDCHTVFSFLTASDGQAGPDCPYCDRRIARRYVCHRCRTMSFESDEQVANKEFSLPIDGPPVPSCPGCLEPASDISVVEHDCPDLAVKYLTGLQVCPFCDRRITRDSDVEVNVQEPASVQEVERLSSNFRYLESLAKPRHSFWRSRLPESRKGWFEFISVTSAIITLVGFIFPSVSAAVWWRISKAVKSPLKVSQILCERPSVMKGDKLSLRVRAEEPASSLKFEWNTSDGKLINFNQRNRESEVELATDAISVVSLPVDVVIGVTVIDEYGDLVRKEQHITIWPRKMINNRPVLTIPPRCNCAVPEVIAGESISLSALAEDADPNDHLTYRWGSSSPSIQITETPPDPVSTATINTVGLNPRAVAVPIKIWVRVDDGIAEPVLGDITLMVLPKEPARTVDRTTTPTNHLPRLVAFVADKTIIQAGETITLQAFIDDPDEGDPTFYDWKTSAGDIQSKGQTAFLNTSGITLPRIFVTLTVSDGHGVTKQQMPIDVRSVSTPTPSPSPSPHPTEVKGP